MAFNTFTYIIFLFFVVSLCWAAPRRFFSGIVLLASVLFYGLWRPEFLLLLLFSIGMDYLFCLGIEAEGSRIRRRALLIASIVMNLGILAFFKYGNFFISQANSLSGTILVLPMDIILPMGISFYIFHSLSYVFDVYRGSYKAERNFVTYCNYVIFFPLLVAGPILRASEVIPQVQLRPDFHFGQFIAGIKRILYGLFLKVVLADQIGSLVNDAAQVGAQGVGAIDVWTIAILFGFQIYFDFSAYSSIAIGSAALLGIRFPENFNFPYLSTSPKEFWTRWHISLSSWIRDYLYLPLSGMKKWGKTANGLAEVVDDNAGHHRTLALFLTWGIMGFWHGANWTFVLWGLWHATLVYAYRLKTRLWPGQVSPALGWAVTFPLVMLGWIPFRIPSVGDTLTMWEKVVTPSQYFSPELLPEGKLAALHLSLAANAYIVCALLVMMTALTPLAHHCLHRWRTSPPLLAFTAETATLAVVTALDFTFLKTTYQFIYFQF